MAATGLSIACPIDTQQRPSFDINSHLCRRQITRSIRDKRFWALHLAPPEIAWTDRSASLSPSAKARGARLAGIVISLIRECENSGTQRSLELPHASLAWRHQPLMRALSESGAQYVSLDLNNFGCSPPRPVIVVCSAHMRRALSLALDLPRPFYLKPPPGLSQAVSGPGRGGRRSKAGQTHTAPLCAASVAGLLPLAPSDARRRAGDPILSTHW